MKVENSDLKLISCVINEPGFKKIEDIIHDRYGKQNTLARINGEAFHDGREQGKAEAYGEIIMVIANLRNDIKKMGGK